MNQKFDLFPFLSVTQSNVTNSCYKKTGHFYCQIKSVDLVIK